MKNDYIEYREKFSKFNQWEKTYLKQTSIADKLKQFSILFDLTLKIPLEKKKKAHKEHLENLIKIQQMLTQK